MQCRDETDVVSSAETLDFRLTDTTAFPIKPEHVLNIPLADGPVPEGNVGGGTGMISFAFKVSHVPASLLRTLLRLLEWERHFLEAAAGRS
jgi:Peptidase family S58